MNEIKNKTTEIEEYSEFEAAVAVLKDQFAGRKFDCETTEGMRDAVAARNQLRGYRTSLETVRKRIKEPALRRTQMIDSEARRIKEAIEAVEVPIQEQIDEVAKRAQREEAERIRKVEEERIAQEKAAKEAEEKRLAEERAKLDAERKAFEEEQRKTREAEEARLAEQRRVEDEAAAQRRAEEEIQRQERLKIEEEQRKLREEREAIERERQKAAQELLDADQMLKVFVARFAHIPRYAAIVRHIRELFD